MLLLYFLPSPTFAKSNAYFKTFETLQQVSVYMFLVFFFFSDRLVKVSHLYVNTLSIGQNDSNAEPNPFPSLSLACQGPQLQHQHDQTNSTVITLKKGNRNLSGCENFKPKIKKSHYFIFYDQLEKVSFQQPIHYSVELTSICPQLAALSFCDRVRMPPYGPIQNVGPSITPN